MGSKNIFDYKARFQWNQPGVLRCLAKTACTDTVCQMIIEYFTDKLISLNDIRKASDIGINCKNGLTIHGALKALRTFGVTHYAAASNVDASFILQKAYLGPVLTGVGYGKYPSMVRSGGRTCDPKNVAQHGGRVDCGFTDRHAVLVIGSTPVKDAKGKIEHYDVFVRDPDHWAETPTFDRFTGAQLTKAMKALVTDTIWSGTFAVYPLRKVK